MKERRIAVSTYCGTGMMTAGAPTVSMCEDRSAADAAGAPRWALWGAAAITTLLRPLGVRIHGQG